MPKSKNLYLIKFKISTCVNYYLYLDNQPYDSTQFLRYRPLSKAVCHTAYSAETIRATSIYDTTFQLLHGRRQRTAAHPTLMLVLQDGFLCCLLLRWSKPRFFPTTRVLPAQEGRSLWGCVWAPSEQKVKGRR